MIITTDFRLDENKREQLPSISEDYPYVCLDVLLDQWTGRSWHWHNAFELDYIISGQMVLRTPSQTCVLSPGDIVFINSQVLHDARAVSQNEKCRLYAQLFYPVFLSGMYGSRIEQKYIAPMQNCHALDLWKIDHCVEADSQAFLLVSKLIALNRMDDFGSEFAIRSVLGQFWCLLLDATKEYRIRNGDSLKKTPDAERLRKMILYIRDHYMDEMRVQDIADSAGISIRECDRCFRRNVDTSPNAFLNDYRLRIAAKMLADTDTSVMTISTECGFQSQSYFGKLFKDAFGTTPVEYRRMKSAYRQ